MDAIRPLRDVLAGLAGGESGGALGDHGYVDLPDDLLAEAIVSYVDTAPAEVAAHLAPFVTAHTSVGLAGPGVEHWDVTQGLDLLASAPTDVELSEAYDVEGDGGFDGLLEPVATPVEGDVLPPDPVELGFGQGQDMLSDLDRGEGLVEDDESGGPADLASKDDLFAVGPTAVDASDVADADDLADDPAFGAGRGSSDGDDQPAVGDDDPSDA